MMLELLEAGDYYEKHRPGYGQLFSDEIERQFVLLTEFPSIGKPVGRSVRRRTLRDWPYSIYYQLRGDEIVIIAIAHHSRRPGYWRARLR